MEPAWLLVEVVKYYCTGVPRLWKVLSSSSCHSCCSSQEMVQVREKIINGWALCGEDRSIEDSLMGIQVFGYILIVILNEAV